MMKVQQLKSRSMNALEMDFWRPFVCVRPGRVQRLMAVSASVRRLVSLPQENRSEIHTYNNSHECGASERGISDTQHRSSSDVTRTSSVSLTRPFSMASMPSSLGDSHTQPANSGLAAFGCYRLIGPARVSKRGECLVARLLPGSRLELLGDAAGNTRAGSNIMMGKDEMLSRTITAESAAAGMMSEGPGWDLQCVCDGEDDNADANVSDSSKDGALSECVLVAAYVELGGSASSVDMVDVTLQPAVHHHNGHTYLSVRNLPSSCIITLSADGDLSHPVNATPPAAPIEALGAVTDAAAARV